MALITQVYSYNFFITNSKVLSITITIINSDTSSNGVARLYTNYESLCTGTSLYDSTPL